MKRSLLLLLAVALLVVSLPSQTGAASGRWERCGRVGSSGQVLAHRVRCPYARHIINGYFRKAQRHGPRVHVLGFKCRGRTPGRHLSVKCHRGLRHRVRWRGTLG